MGEFKTDLEEAFLFNRKETKRTKTSRIKIKNFEAVWSIHGSGGLLELALYGTGRFFAGG